MRTMRMSYVGSEVAKLRGVQSAGFWSATGSVRHGVSVVGDANDAGASSKKKCRIPARGAKTPLL